MKKTLLAILTILLNFQAFAQNQYFVLFKDKANSPYSITRPKEFLSDRSIKRRANQNITIIERDLPPNPSYLSDVVKTGAKILYKSRWLKLMRLRLIKF